jgi:hypothetical protein
LKRQWQRRGIYGLRSSGSPGRVGSQGSDAGNVTHVGSDHVGSDGGGSQRTALSAPAGINTHSEHKAMVPSFRLKEECEKRRLLQAENKALKERIAELELVQKLKRDEFVFRRGKRTG